MTWYSPPSRLVNHHDKHGSRSYSCSWLSFLHPVEWRLFSLRLLSETTALLVSQEPEDSDAGAGCDPDSNLLALFRDELLPQ